MNDGSYEFLMFKMLEALQCLDQAYHIIDPPESIKKARENILDNIADLSYYLYLDKRYKENERKRGGQSDGE